MQRAHHGATGASTSSQVTTRGHTQERCLNHESSVNMLGKFRAQSAIFLQKSATRMVERAMLKVGLPSRRPAAVVVCKENVNSIGYTSVLANRSGRSNDSMHDQRTAKAHCGRPSGRLCGRRKANVALRRPWGGFAHAKKNASTRIKFALKPWGCPTQRERVSTTHTSFGSPRSVSSRARSFRR